MKELHKAKMTANMVMVTDANGQPSASDKITKTELNMLNNVRSNIQTQIDAKAEKIDKYVDYSKGKEYLFNVANKTETEGGDKWVYTATVPCDCVVYIEIRATNASSLDRLTIFVDSGVSSLTVYLGEKNKATSYIPLFLKSQQTVRVETFSNPEVIALSCRAFYLPWGS